MAPWIARKKDRDKFAAFLVAKPVLATALFLGGFLFSGF
jgi:hypothetical protein